MSVAVQRMCAWSGVAMMVVFGAGLFVGGVFPPLAPNASLAEVQGFHEDDPTRLRAGLLVALYGVALRGPAFAIVTLQLQRIAGVGPVLARVQSMAATAAWVFLVLPCSSSRRQPSGPVAISRRSKR